MCELQSYCEIQLESALGYSPVGLHRQQLFVSSPFQAHYRVWIERSSILWSRSVLKLSRAEKAFITHRHPLRTMGPGESASATPSFPIQTKGTKVCVISKPDSLYGSGFPVYLCYLLEGSTRATLVLFTFSNMWFCLLLYIHSFSSLQTHPFYISVQNSWTPKIHRSETCLCHSRFCPVHQCSILICLTSKWRNEWFALVNGSKYILGKSGYNINIPI